MSKVGKIKSYVASVPRTGPGFPVHSTKKILLGIFTSLQLRDSWGPVQMKGGGALVQKLLRIVRGQ